jgi:metal-sulfur cluster biosynthetic enzyme
MNEGNNPSMVKWNIMDSNPEIVDLIKEKLRQVIDPEIGLSIIELGLVRNINFVDDQVDIEMILTTPFCPYGPALMEMARKKVEEVTKKTTTIKMATTPWTPAMMEDSTAFDWGLY